jgi:hypothetical protein
LEIAPAIAVDEDERILWSIRRDAGLDVDDADTPERFLAF